MDAMTIPDVWSGQDRALTVEDMENMPDDGFRYELDDGRALDYHDDTRDFEIVGTGERLTRLPTPPA